MKIIDIKKSILLLFLSLIVILNSNVMAFASNTKKSEKIRVGFYDFAYFQEIDEKGNYSGYSYDYLQAIAQYTGWDYEYITYATSSECLEMLKNGEIDLMGVVKKTPEREEIYDFPNFPSGTSMSMLVTDRNNLKYAYEDFKTFDGMTIALQKSFARNNDLFDYCKKNGFTVNTIVYDTKEDFTNAITSGKVDAGLISSNQISPLLRTIAKFNSSDVYYITTKGNEKVLNGLNYAINKIKTNIPSFDYDLYKNHYSFSEGQTAVFSQEELEYINSNPILNVLCDSTRPPFEIEEQKNVTGITIDVLNEISKITNITFKYTVAKNRDEKNEIINNGGFDIISAINYDYNWADRNNVFITQPYIEVPFVTIYKNEIKAQRTLALPKGYHFSQTLEDKLSENVKVIYYENVYQCIEAVYNGDADYTFANNYESNYYLSIPKYRTLNFRTILGISESISIGISKNDDFILYSIIEKSLQSIPNEKLQDIIRLNTSKAESNDFLDMMYTNPIQFLTIIGFIFVILLLLVIVAYFNYNNKKKNTILQIATTAKSDFLSRMSHDMRTPMNAIIGFSRMGLEEKTDINELHNYMKNINYSAKYLLGLINDILDMSKIENNKIVLNYDEVNSKELFEGIISSVKPMMDDKNIEFELKIDGFKDNVNAVVDKMRLQQIFINLLSNAAKYTPNNGKVECIVENLGFDNDDNALDRIIIRDNGVGMSKEFQKKLFQPFEQEHNDLIEKQPGIGLGLSIVKNLVELMGGTITVNSELGKGTEFIIELKTKIVYNDNIDEASEVKISNNENFKGKNVLIIEDHPLNTEIAKKLLTKMGFIVTTAENGLTGYDIFVKSQIGYFSLILMDIRMPVMGGLEASRKIRETQRPDAQTISIIAMTANAFDDDVKESIDAGMNAHIAKPINPKILYETIGKFIKK